MRGFCCRRVNKSSPIEQGVNFVSHYRDDSSRTRRGNRNPPIHLSQYIHAIPVYIHCFKKRTFQAMFDNQSEGIQSYTHHGSIPCLQRRVGCSWPNNTPRLPRSSHGGAPVADRQCSTNLSWSAGLRKNGHVHNTWMAPKRNWDFHHRHDLPKHWDVIYLNECIPNFWYLKMGMSTGKWWETIKKRTRMPTCRITNPRIIVVQEEKGECKCGV